MLCGGRIFVNRFHFFGKYMVTLFSHSVTSNSLWPHGLQHTCFPCPSPSPGAYSNSCPLSRWCHPAISSSLVLFSAFSLSQHQGFFHWVGSGSFTFSIGSSNEYSGLVSFRIDSLISLLSKGLSRVFSNTTVRSHKFFGALPSLWSVSHIHTWLLEKP